MPRRIAPVRPRDKLEADYLKDLRRRVLNPLFVDIREGLAEAAAVRQALAAIEQAVAKAETVRGVPIALIRKSLDRIKGFHKADLIKTFRAALKIDIRPVLIEPPIDAFMRQKVAENVDLIRTIPRRAHGQLTNAIRREFLEAPFDEYQMRKIIRQGYRSSGYNLRRIVRDQNSKMVGQLTEIRHRQMRIESYQWSTSKDERVRPTHRANSDKTFKWDKPPPATGHPGQDIMCRCVAIPVIPTVRRPGGPNITA